MTRRGFVGRVIGGLAAAYAAPRALFAREPLTTLDLQAPADWFRAPHNCPHQFATPYYSGPPWIGDAICVRCGTIRRSEQERQERFQMEARR